MKQIFFLALMLFSTSHLYATLRRVNNNPGIILPAFGYANFASAQNASAAGDTIYFEPSNISYGSITLDRKLFLVGPGFLLDQNSGTPADKRSSILDKIFFPASSTTGGINLINGTTITGLVIGDLTVNGFNSTAYENITISRCYIKNKLSNSSGVFASFVNSNFQQNLILGNTPSNINFINCVISNNILYKFYNITESVFKNNLIYATPNFQSSSQYYNNIFIGSNSNSDTISLINVYNNVCVNFRGTATNNNFYTTSYNTIFQATEPRIIDDLEDARFQLATTSPAKTKGVAGVDCGPFGGANPYVLSGIPAFPSITAVTAGAQVAGNIPITFSAKRNN